MLPKINNRFKSQNGFSNIMRKQRSLFMKSRENKNLNLRQSIPYLQQFKFNTIDRIEKSYSKKLKKSRLKTEFIINQSQNQISIQEPEEIRDQYLQQRKQSLTFQLKQQNIKKSPVNRLLKMLNAYEIKLSGEPESKQLKKKCIINDLKFQRAYQEYKKLPINKYNWTGQTIGDFLWVLSQMNPFFRKTKQIISICLLKIGKIRTYEQNEIFQRQDDPMKNIGVLLWGQLLLKNVDSRIKIYLFPGDSFNQQLLFPNMDKKNYQRINKTKGYLSIKQSGKTKTKAGILFLKVKQYRAIFEELVKIGEKSSFLLVENMMKWSYSKKKNLRKQHSHL